MKKKKMKCCLLQTAECFCCAKYLDVCGQGLKLKDGIRKKVTKRAQYLQVHEVKENQNNENLEMETGVA